MLLCVWTALYCTILYIIYITTLYSSIAQHHPGATSRGRCLGHCVAFPGIILRFLGILWITLGLLWDYSGILWDTPCPTSIPSGLGEYIHPFSTGSTRVYCSYTARVHYDHTTTTLRPQKHVQYTHQYIELDQPERHYWGPILSPESGERG